MLLHFNQSHRGRNNCTSSIKLTVPFIYFTHVHHNDDNYPLCKSHFLGLKLWQRDGDWSPTHLRRWWYFLESMSCHRTWRRDTEELSISERLVSAGNWNECPPPQHLLFHYILHQMKTIYHRVTLSNHFYPQRKKDSQKDSQTDNPW